MTAIALLMHCEQPIRGESANRGYFSVRQKEGSFCLVDPDGIDFFSLALNHIDPAVLLREGIFQEKYKNDIHIWLTEVGKDIKDWGFNSIGWVRETATNNRDNHRHSRNFTFEEYQSLGMPYFHMLPFIESHQWENETRMPDIESSGFQAWCEYVAERECTRFASDSNLIGYFYADCPAWIHSFELNSWKAPYFDPEMLVSEKGRKEIRRIAGVFYKVTYEAIRRFDKHHLIFGDRYNAGRPMSAEIVEASLPYIDVLSFQHFGAPDDIAENLNYWARYEKPTLLADFAYKKTEDHYKVHEPEIYRELLQKLLGVKSCVGSHLCGAYLRNEVRKYGLKSSLDLELDETKDIKTANYDFLKNWNMTISS